MAGATTTIIQPHAKHRLPLDVPAKIEWKGIFPLRSPEVQAPATFKERVVSFFRSMGKKNAPKGYWNDSANRISWTCELVASLPELKGDPKNLTSKHFTKNGLGGLMQSLDFSAFAAVSEAYPEMKIKAWEMASGVPHGFFDKPGNIIGAVRWTMKKYNVRSWELKAAHFEGKLWYMFVEHCGGSPYKAACMVNWRLKEQPWRMIASPHTDVAKEAKHRVAAVRWLCKVTKKEPTQLQCQDFIDRHLNSILKYYRNSPYLAAREAFLERNIRQEDMYTEPKQILKKVA